MVRFQRWWLSSNFFKTTRNLRNDLKTGKSYWGTLWIKVNIYTRNSHDTLIVLVETTDWNMTEVLECFLPVGVVTDIFRLQAKIELTFYNMVSYCWKHLKPSAVFKLLFTLSRLTFSVAFTTLEIIACVTVIMLLISKEANLSYYM